jgi:glycosyltransferase involved in cell wall biosynthesis
MAIWNLEALVKVSIVIPTKNEEATLEPVIIGAKSHADEIFIIDGHSTDRTREIAQSHGIPVHLDAGKGKGEAMRMAADIFAGDILVYLDADGSHLPDDIPRLLEPILKNEADMVIGSRFKGGSDELVGNVNQLFRITGSNIITTFINYRWNVHLSDTQNGFRALTRDAAKALNLHINGFPIETEMDIQLLQRGFRIGEVPAHEYRRKGGESKIKLWKIWHQYPILLIKTLMQRKYLPEAAQRMSAQPAPSLPE